MKNSLEIVNPKWNLRVRDDESYPGIGNKMTIT